MVRTQMTYHCLIQRYQIYIVIDSNNFVIGTPVMQNSVEQVLYHKQRTVIKSIVIGHKLLFSIVYRVITYSQNNSLYYQLCVGYNLIQYDIVTITIYILSYEL